jgi:hypothetical protein
VQLRELRKELQIHDRLYQEKGAASPSLHFEVALRHVIKRSMGYSGTITKNLMCSAQVQIIYVDQDSDTTVLNKYSKWVSLKLYALGVQETKFLREIRNKKINDGVCNYVYLFDYEQRSLLHISATCHGHLQGGVF